MGYLVGDISKGTDNRPYDLTNINGRTNAEKINMIKMASMEVGIMF